MTMQSSRQAFRALKEMILSKGERVFEIQAALTATMALGPENGGQGEAQKAALIEKWLKNAGITDIRHYNSPDDRVECGHRPNLVARVQGQSDRRLWLFGHMDVVPAGDPGLWRANPWQALRENDLIYGRGVEDNQQAVASMLTLAECLAQTGVIPAIGLGLVFMADEECGSRHGLSWLLKNAPDLFSPDDYYIVPDGGSPDGALIEIAEKGQLWIRFETLGAQCHASTPDKGRNAFLAASDLVLSLARLPELFPLKNELFLPPGSTFAPTRHDANVEAINIIPAKDVFYMDCRLLPEVPISAVMAAIGEICAEAGRRHEVKIEAGIVQRQPATATQIDTPVMAPLGEAIRAVYGVNPVPVGIGGATVAAMLREKNLPAVVWSTIRNTCHQPDECSSIAATLGDAVVFSHILTSQAGAGH